MRSWTGRILAGATLLPSSLALAAEVPVLVSPGSAESTVIESRCPTFSWAPVDGAKAHELVVYRLGATGGEMQPVARRRVPGGASAWTPALEDCLHRGGRYAWSVRAVHEGDRAWSPPSLFEVTASPAAAEILAALEVLRGRQPVADPVAGPRFTRDAAADSPRSSSMTRRSVAEPLSRSTPFLTGRPGVVGEVDAEPGERTFGVMGIISADAGSSAGVYGEDTAGSPFSYGVFGVSHSDDSSAGVFGYNDSPDDSHGQATIQLHSYGVSGRSVHVDGIGVVGFAPEERGSGVVGVGHVGVRGFTCLREGELGACDAVYADDGTTDGYGGFFANPAGDLIGAHAEGDLDAPTFRVDNVGRVHAAGFDLTPFAVRSASNSTSGAATKESPSCNGDEVLIGGGCECSNGSLERSYPNSTTPTFWRCECSANGVEAHVLCLAGG